MSTMLYTGIGELVTSSGGVKRGRAMNDTGVISDGAFAVSDGIFTAVGRKDELLTAADYDSVADLGGALVTPGIVDPHTHAVFGGERSEEFLRRLSGDGYMEIMRQGGGIASTVRATRTADEDALVAGALPHLKRMLSMGVTTCEVKSGYGLDTDTELRQLRAVKRLGELQSVETVPTFMGAHAVPEGMTADGYIDYCREFSIPAAARSGMAVFADVFCEAGVFDLEQSERYLLAARREGLLLKLHADEMTCLGGAGLGARLGAVSVDHLLKISAGDMAAIAHSDTVATVLPLTAFCLSEPYAPARELIDSGAIVAAGSDFNPGSCCSYSVPLLIALCCIYMKMSVDETLTAITVNAAAACGVSDRVGSIEPGKQADFAVFDCERRHMLPYFSGVNLVKSVFKKGKRVYNV